MSIIEVKAISKKYGDKSILDNLNWKIDTPGIYALVGPNGVGKSTLLNIMVNLISPDEGEILFNGQSNKDISIFYHVSFLKDNTVLYPYLTGLDHLRYAAMSYKLPNEQINQVTNMLNIFHFMERKVKNYSLGMKQLLLIALVLLNDPDILIMDEPLNGLDPSRILEVRHILEELKLKGKTIILSSHLLGEVDAITADIYFLHDGQIYYDPMTLGTAEEKYKQLFN